MAVLPDAANFDVAGVQTEGIGNGGSGGRRRVDTRTRRDNRNIVQNLDGKSSRSQSYGVAIAICCDDIARQIDTRTCKQVFGVISVGIIQSRMVDLTLQREDVRPVAAYSQREDFTVARAESRAIAALDVARESCAVGNDLDLFML